MNAAFPSNLCNRCFSSAAPSLRDGRARPSRQPLATRENAREGSGAQSLRRPADRETVGFRGDGSRSQDREGDRRHRPDRRRGRLPDRPSHHRGRLAPVHRPDRRQAPAAGDGPRKRRLDRVGRQGGRRRQGRRPGHRASEDHRRNLSRLPQGLRHARARQVSGARTPTEATPSTSAPPSATSCRCPRPSRRRTSRPIRTPG